MFSSFFFFNNTYSLHVSPIILASYLLPNNLLIPRCTWALLAENHRYLKIGGTLGTSETEKAG